MNKFFSIRCPSSIINPPSSVVHSIFDFEDLCTDSDRTLGEVAFCGRCAKNSDTIVQNINSSLTFRYVNIIIYFNALLTNLRRIVKCILPSRIT